ncbi:UDP-3-O-(3-hydroxymyristoyl)glucosamine N-acyltransferase [Halocola ammonii]
MKLSPSKTLAEIAEMLGCEYVGDPNHEVSGINEIHKVVPGDLVFVDHPKYYDKALQSAATTILIDKEVDCPEGKGLLVSKHPFDDFNKLTKKFNPFTPWTEEQDESAEIGEDTIVHPRAVIGPKVKIGKRCIIHSGVVIYDDTVIGDDVIIHANAVIGANAFYYKKKGKEYDRMHTCGRVVIGNKVELGACTTVDRGVTGDTIIGDGCKFDNHVHIGHDSEIGKNCLFAAQVGVSGCVWIEDNVTLWGQVGVPSDLRIGENAVVLGQSGLTKSLEPNKTYFGSPAGEVREKFKEIAMIRKLPKIIEKLK